MPLIAVEGLQKSFGVPVIDDLSFAVDEGEAVGIVGPNGAGKTTLLNLIAGELAPDHGHIRSRVATSPGPAPTSGAGRHRAGRRRSRGRSRG